MTAIINWSSKINAMYSAYTIKLDLYTRKIYIGIQKINRSHLNTFGIVIADCLAKNKLEKVCFF